MADEYLRGMLQGGNPILSKGISNPMGRQTSPSSSNPYKGKPTYGKALNSDVDALQGQDYAYNLMEGQFNADAVGYQNKIYKIIKDKYHGDVSAAYSDEGIQNMLGDLRQRKANLGAIRSSIETTKKTLEAEYTDASKKLSLQDFAVDHYGNRFIMDEKGVIKRAGRKLEQGQRYVTTGEYLDTKRHQMGFMQVDGGPVVAEEYQHLQILDNKVDYISEVAATWMPKSGTDSEKTKYSQSSSRIAYNEFREHAVKSNEKRLGMMAQKLSSSLSPKVELAMKQRYWKSAMGNNAMYRLKRRDGKGNVITHNVRGADGKIVKEPTYYVNYVSEEDIEASTSMNPEDRSDIQKEYAEMKELGDNIKFAYFTESEFGSYVDPMINDYIGLGEGGSSGAAGRKINFDGFNKGVLERMAKYGEGDVRIGTIYRVKESGMNDPDGVTTFTRQDYTVPVAQFDATKGKALAKTNHEFQSTFTNTEGQVIRIPDEASMDKIAPVISMFGSILSGDDTREMYLYSMNPKYLGLPGTETNRYTGEADWAKGDQMESWRTATVMMSKEKWAEIEGKLVGEASVNTSDGVVSKGKDFNEDVELRGGFDANKSWVMGFTPSKMAEQYNIREISVSGISSNDMILVDIAIPPQASQQITMSDKPSQHNADVLAAYDQAYLKKMTDRAEADQIMEQNK